MKPLAVLFLIGVTSGAAADTVCVKYGPCPLDLAPFRCSETPQSSFVRRVCYDAAKQFMVIKLNDTWYPYCEVRPENIGALLSAPSIGSYYNQRFRSQGNRRGPFDCRDHPLPKY